MSSTEKQFPNSWVSLYQLTLYKNTWPADSVRFLFNRMTGLLQESTYGKQVAEKIAFSDQAKTSIGNPAINFTTSDLNGDLLSLSTYKGRYVLLDFWGSWCVPCRAGHPHLIGVYKKYKQKGIEFIGVACQENGPGNWKKAVDKDSIHIWKHVLDNESEAVGKNVSIRKRYAIDSFPTKILIDPTGIIIGRYTGGEEALLDKKLAELFN